MTYMSQVSKKKVVQYLQLNRYDFVTLFANLKILDANKVTNSFANIVHICNFEQSSNKQI